jgi:membrane-associated phospholipid phosphatase
MDNRRRTTTALTLILALVTPAPRLSWADENTLFSKDYFRRLGNDVSALPGTVSRWQKNHWLIAGGVLGLTAAVYSVDAETREDFGSKQLGGRHDSFSKSVKPFGDYRYLAPLIAGAWIGGLATHNPTLSKIAADSFEVNIIATGLVTPAFSLLAGRQRPYSEKSSLDFSPFNSGRTSFPSGHTTAAFATAAVLDANLRSKFGYWHTPVVYSVATAVGLSRVYDQKHHPSDVVMGAAVGSAIGYWVASRRRNKEKDFSLDVEPSSAKFKFRFGGRRKEEF